MPKSKYEIARKRVKKKIDFRSHLISYLVTCAFLIAVNLMTSPGYLWAIWPALGWGMAVAFNGFEAYGIIGDKDKEEEMIALELRRMELNERHDDDIEDELEDDHLELRDVPIERKYSDDEFV